MAGYDETLELVHGSQPENSSPSSLFRDPRFLGFKHDGYPISTFLQYRKTRAIPDPTKFDRDHATMLQSWLSFGLLEATLEQPVSENALVKRTEAGKMIMSMEELPRILLDWTSQAREEISELAAYRDRIDAILHQVHKILGYLSEGKHWAFFDYEGADSDDLPQTFVFLGCVAEALTQARLCLYPDSSPTRGYSWECVLAPCEDRLNNELITDGWCPSAITYILSKGGLLPLRYAARRGPLDRTECHDKCSKFFCAAKIINVATYVPRHLTTSESTECSCLYIKPSVDAIISMIQGGTIPVIRVLEPYDRGKTSLAVVSSKDVPYVAISHVWVDGSGSTTEVGLPLCQVWSLSVLMSGVLPPGAFWIDALCVPKDPSTRKSALKMMGKAYRDAEFVLVRDNTIRSCSSRAPLEEILLHILMSPWMRRLWTLQEALLSKKLVFQFSDSLLPIHSIVPNLSTLMTDYLHVGLASELYRLTKLRTFRNLKFSDVAKSLRWRFTSNAEDEIPAIVSLLDVDGAAILDIPTADQRMAKLLLELQHLSPNIIFLKGPKLPIPGFRWAPATLMSMATGRDTGSLDLFRGAANAVCTPKGLEAELFVFGFEERRFGVAERWTLVDSIGNGKSFFVSYTQHGSSEYSCNFLLCARSGAPTGIEICLGVLGSLSFEKDNVEGVLNCVHGTPLLVNGQRPDSKSENEVTVLMTGMRRVCIL